MLDEHGMDGVAYRELHTNDPICENWPISQCRGSNFLERIDVIWTCDTECDSILPPNLLPVSASLLYDIMA